MLQLIQSYRAHDPGPQADTFNSGYERLLISPGVEVRIKRLRLSADVEIPIYQRVNSAPSLAIEQDSGQLVAPELIKVSMAYDF